MVLSRALNASAQYGQLQMTLNAEEGGDSKRGVRHAAWSHSQRVCAEESKLKRKDAKRAIKQPRPQVTGQRSPHPFDLTGLICTIAVEEASLFHSLMVEVYRTVNSDPDGLYGESIAVLN